MLIICDTLGSNTDTAVLLWEFSVQELAAEILGTDATDLNYLESKRISLRCSLIRTCVDAHNNVKSLI